MLQSAPHELLVMVRGRPVRQFQMPSNSQFPSKAFTIGEALFSMAWPLPNGRTYTQLVTELNLMLFPESAFSARKSYAFCGVSEPLGSFQAPTFSMPRAQVKECSSVKPRDIRFSMRV